MAKVAVVKVAALGVLEMVEDDEVGVGVELVEVGVEVAERGTAESEGEAVAAGRPAGEVAAVEVGAVVEGLLRVDLHVDGPARAAVSLLAEALGDPRLQVPPRVPPAVVRRDPPHDPPLLVAVGLLDRSTSESIDRSIDQ